MSFPFASGLRDHVAKAALSIIDHANHKPENRGHKPKVGGHQASSMSAVDLLSALYLEVLRPGDRVAVKPHAAPVVYAWMHLFGELPREQLFRLRELGGPQPYPTKLKNPRFVDYTTSSEALGVCATIYDALAARVHDRTIAPHTGEAPVRARYFAHCGDGELTEGQIDESLYDAGRWGLDDLVWIVDLNRQSLDRVMDDSGRLEGWAAAKFRGHGWGVQTLRWGSAARALFARDGGDALQAVLDRMPDAAFHPLLLVDGRTVRALLLGETATAPTKTGLFARFPSLSPMSVDERAGIAKLLAGVDDASLSAAIAHLGGHDLDAIVEALGACTAGGGPRVLIAHTVKGYQTSAAAHPENHGALLSSEEVAAWGTDRGLPAGEPFPVPQGEAAAWLADRARALFPAKGHAWRPAPRDVRGVTAGIPFRPRERLSSGEAFQSLNLALLRTDLAPYLQFGAPDVGQTTHLGPVIKSTGVFAPRPLPDTFDFLRDERALAFDWRPEPAGQFHALGIAEGNAMLWAYAFGRRTKPIEGRTPLLPVVTVYDKFIERGFNQLDYAVYNNARFVLVGVPSGTGLSRETATHQSLQTLRMVMDLPGIIAYEPAFAADVHAIYLHALAQLWDDDGTAVYLRLTTQTVDQPVELPEDHAALAVRGAWWMIGEDDRKPALGHATVVFVASGRKVADARTAAKRLHDEDGVGSRILVVTSWEALWREWDAWNEDPAAWSDEGRSYLVHELFTDDLVNAPLIIVGDHLPSACEWFPSALQRVRPYRILGPRKNGEAGDLAGVDALHGMGVDDLVEAARADLRWRATR